MQKNRAFQAEDRQDHERLNRLDIELGATSKFKEMQEQEQKKSKYKEELT